MADTIFRKTEAGRLAFKQRGELSQRQRTAFILFDGVRGTREVLKSTEAMGTTPDDIRSMLERGFLERVSASQDASDSAFVPSLDVTLDHDESAAVIQALATSQTPSAESAPAAPPMAEPAAASTGNTNGPAAALTEDQMRERYKQAYPIAVALTSSLGLRGFRLNLAVEAAGGYAQLVELLPRLRESVGPTKLADLEQALGTKGDLRLS